MDYLVVTYSVYIVITILLTIWVGKTLFVNGKVFLMQIFQNDEVLVDSINKLLLVGFYLINFGYALQNLIVRKQITTLAKSIEMLSLKIGIIIVVLGVMHFFNLFVLFVLRSKALKATDPLPE